MKEENRWIDDPLDTNIANEVQKRETARMEASFRDLVEAGLGAAETAKDEHPAADRHPQPETTAERKPAERPAAPKTTERPAPPKTTERPAVTRPAEKPAAAKPAETAAPAAAPVHREITIDEGATPARKPSEPQRNTPVKRPDPHDPAVDTVIYDPESEDIKRAKRAAQHANSGRRAQRRHRRAILTENARIIVKDIIIACIIALVISAFIRPTIVQETSMEPTVEPQDYLLMSRQAYRFGELERGDIVIFKSDLKLDETHNKLLIKRVIGLPGDTISVSGGEVYLNGEAIKEPYIAEGGTPGYVEEITLGAGEVFVMGDHREVSVDSRTFGPIEKDMIVGQAVFRLWPLSGFGTLD